jgi:hypothetical protein
VVMTRSHHPVHTITIQRWGIMKRKALILFPVIFCLILLMRIDSAADTIRLFQGSVLVGKIVTEDKTAVVLANYHGTYRIKRIKIDDLFKTNSYQEDIAVHQKLNLPFNKNEIMRNYSAGQDRKDGKMPAQYRGEAGEEKAPPAPGAKKKIEPKELEADTSKDTHWKSGRLSFSGVFHYNLGPSKSAIPYGYGGFFSLDQGLDFTSGSPRVGIPGLRFEGGYLYFKRGSYTMTGYIAGGGLMWALPSMKNSWGCIIIALIPGATYLKARLSDPFFGFGGSSSTGFNFAGQALFGYQKSWGVFSIFIQARYMYILASGSYFHSIGGEAGFGFNAW